VDVELARFLAAGDILSTTSVTWGDGTRPLSISYCWSAAALPIEYVSSARAFVFQENTVLVVKEPSGQFYLLPGGRLEKGESILEALRREILEETGWTIRDIAPLGFMHFHHLGNKPPDYQYPYPDFIWPIYMAEAEEYIADSKVPDDYVEESYFVPLEKVKQLLPDKGQLALFNAALDIRPPA
jgi:8-oxo-dGTP pyrophosphatase MutT (NUDIX family)